MKFLIPLGFRYGGEDVFLPVKVSDRFPDGQQKVLSKEDPVYSHIGSVYGPYEDDKAVEEEIARHWPNDKTEQFLVFDGQVVNVKPSPKEKPESEKREPGHIKNYVKNGEGYTCKDCGGAILGGKVEHPVHLREMPGAGSGECQYETIPYCPNCDKEPNFYGAPVYAD